MGVTLGGRTRMQKGPPPVPAPRSHAGIPAPSPPSFIARTRPAGGPWHKKPSCFPHLKTRQGGMPPPQLPACARTAVSRADAHDKRGSLPARVATQAPQELPGHAGLL